MYKSYTANTVSIYIWITTVYGLKVSERQTLIEINAQHQQLFSSFLAMACCLHSRPGWVLHACLKSCYFFYAPPIPALVLQIAQHVRG